MHYPQAFFELQLLFARKRAALLVQPYQQAILHNTALYRILGLDWSFDASNPVWQAYMQGLEQEQSDVEWTYRFYLSRHEDIPGYHTPRWGCFSYEYLSDRQAIHMHFANLDFSGYGPLTSLRMGARLTELRSMYGYIRAKHPDAQVVLGSSWLYNRKEYTRLFPPEYGQSARADKPHLHARGLWGQFLRHNVQINETLASLFRERVDQLREAEHYAQCFPYQAMLTRAPIELFYAFYGL